MVHIVTQIWRRPLDGQEWEVCACGCCGLAVCARPLPAGEGRRWSADADLVEYLNAEITRLERRPMPEGAPRAR